MKATSQLLEEDSGVVGKDSKDQGRIADKNTERCGAEEYLFPKPIWAGRGVGGLN